MLPNFLIVGPPKSGTTSLQLYLNRHPDIFCRGETHYYDENYNKGIKWYEKQFEKAKGEKRIGEKTPDYFYIEGIPEKIKKDFPDIKLLFILRDPIKRAYSHYYHNLRRGVEEKSFEKHLNEKSIYINVSMYIEHIKRWKKYFSEKQMYFLKMNDLNQTKLQKIAEFLRVESNFDFGELKRYNIGGSPRTKTLAKISQNKKKKKIPILSEGIKRGINMKRGKYPEMKKETEQKLKKIFKPYNEELKKQTNLNFNK